MEGWKFADAGSTVEVTGEGWDADGYRSRLRRANQTDGRYEAESG